VIVVHRSNRIEALAGALAGVVAAAPPDPFESECIVVQGRGMERWLSMQLAQAHGVWANPQFLFPRRFLLERVFAPLLGREAGDAEPWDRDTLVWSIAAALPALQSRPEFADVRHYLQSDATGRRRVRLARRIAELFDDYAIYRPELVRGWERGDAPVDWQAVLWRGLVERQGGEHMGALVERCVERLVSPGEAPAGLPGRISVFGLHALPPLFRRAFEALGQRADVHFFIPSPAREYWADLRPERELARAEAQGRDLFAEHLEGGHPLLASLAGASREFDDALAGLDEVDERAYFEDPLQEADTLLRRLQHDLLVLGAARPAAADGSIEVHACHGPLREVEVLRDRILSCMADDPELRPDDFAVLTPDVDRYAPVVEAVFAGSDGLPALPLGVADRRPDRSHALVEAFFALLDVVRGRLSAAEMIDLLGRDPVRARFGLDGADLERVRDWVERSGIRWGVDAEQRGAWQQPEIELNTWRWGLDRLLLGYALGDRPSDAGLGDVIAAGDIDAGLAETLGRFVDFCETMFELREALARARTPAEHARELLEALERLLEVDDAAADAFQALRDALERIIANSTCAEFDERLALDAIRPELERALAAGAGPTPHGFLAGGVTLCELLPMRGLPFRVVALLGMAESAFPRREVRVDFDRIASRPRPGDRSRREEDRQLFLDALLAARDRLIVIYPGRSPSNGAERPASAVVEELVDWLERGHGIGRSDIEVCHPLHAFSPAGFVEGADPRLHGFDPGACRAAASLVQPASEPPPFFSGVPLPAREPERVVDVEVLARFLRNPSRHFLQAGLGVLLKEAQAELPSREPLELDALERWKIGDAALERGSDVVASLEHARRCGALPPAALGTWMAQRIGHRVQAVLSAGRAQGWSPELEIRSCTRPLGDFVCQGRIGGWIDDEHRVELEYRGADGPAELSSWVQHVFASWMQGRDVETVLVSRADDVRPRITRFGKVGDPARLIATWFEWWREGAQRPLPIFGWSSRVYASACIGGASGEVALARARQAFVGGSGRRGDAGDAYVTLATRGRDPLDAEFCERALELWTGPLESAVRA
jgi:exodeoxyribonuclease V gamma subunit